MRVFHQNESCLLALSLRYNLREDGASKATLILIGHYSMCICSNLLCNNRLQWNFHNNFYTFTFYQSDLMVWLLHVEFIIDLNDIRCVVSPTIRLFLLSCHNMSRDNCSSQLKCVPSLVAVRKKCEIQCTTTIAPFKVWA